MFKNIQQNVNMTRRKMEDTAIETIQSKTDRRKMKMIKQSPWTVRGTQSSNLIHVTKVPEGDGGQKKTWGLKIFQIWWKVYAHRFKKLKNLTQKMTKTTARHIIIKLLTTSEIDRKNLNNSKKKGKETWKEKMKKSVPLTPISMFCLAPHTVPGPGEGEPGWYAEVVQRCGTPRQGGCPPSVGWLRQWWQEE